MLRNSLAVLAIAVALVACGDNGGDTNDAGGRADGGGADSGVRPDSSTPRPDSGPADECATDEALETLGCNGWLTGDAPANAAFGSCTVGDETNPAGSCTDANTVCGAAKGETTGQCIPLCPLADTYVSGGCPAGSRCFSFRDDTGICYRDCDATHACPAGEMCDDDGSCVVGPVTPDPDAGTPVDDGGIVLPDASTDADGGSEPDAGVTP